MPRPAAPGGAVPRCEGWSIVPGLTVCVVDRPALLSSDTTRGGFLPTAG